MSAPGEQRRRDRMVREVVARRGVKDARVLEAMRRVPRHLFVRETLQGQAYSEHALPIGAEQTISQPYIVAKMAELLELEPRHSVLEIGTGTGYSAAVLALLAARVFSLERVPQLARQAIRRIRSLGYDNIKIQTFDGTFGWSEVGPFDRVVVTAGAPRAPKPLLDQLKIDGILLIPEGTRKSQKLVLYRRTAKSVLRQEGEEVAFVPLIGRFGWEAG